MSSSIRSIDITETETIERRTIEIKLPAAMTFLLIGHLNLSAILRDVHEKNAAIEKTTNIVPNPTDKVPAAVYASKEVENSSQALINTKANIGIEAIIINTDSSIFLYDKVISLR